MQEWLANLNFNMKRHGFVGLLRQARRRILGPSNRELLSQIEALRNDALPSEALIERIDATMRYLADKASQESEKRITEVIERKLPGGSLAVLDAGNQILGALKTMDIRSAEISSSIAELRREFGEYARRQAIAIIDPAGQNFLFSDYGSDLMVPSSEQALLLYFMRKGLRHIEPGVRQVIFDNVRAGDTAVDIGANVGLHALLMARLVGPKGFLHAFEPHPVIVEALRQTMSINGFTDHVSVEDKVILDKPGEIDFWMGNHSPVSSIFAAESGGAPIAKKRKTISLDAHFAPGTRIDFVKMDAEGAEPLIIKGMERVFRENPDIKVVMEVSANHFERSHLNMGEFYNSLSRDGFSVHEVSDTGSLVVVPNADAFAKLEESNVLLRRG